MRITITNLEDNLGLGGIGERGCNMHDGINAWDVLSFRKYGRLLNHRPFTTCERSEVARSSTLAVVNLSPKDS